MHIPNKNKFDVYGCPPVKRIFGGARILVGQCHE